MPYTTAGGRLARQLDVDMSPAAPISATGAGAVIELGDKGTLRLTQNVSAVSGTNPTLDTAVQTSRDNGVTDSWRTIASFPQATGTGSVRRSFTGCDHWVRLNHTLGGTATPTVTVTFTGSGV